MNRKHPIYMVFNEGDERIVSEIPQYAFQSTILDYPKLSEV